MKTYKKIKTRDHGIFFQSWSQKISSNSKVVNNNARDIRRKVDVISKKCQELKNLVVAIAVAYSKTKPDDLHVFGDGRMSKVIEKHKDDILLDPDWLKNDNNVENLTANAMLLRLLPDVYTVFMALQ